MSKKDITDLLKKKDVMVQSHAKELDFIRLAVERINNRDYAGLISIAKQNGVSLKPLYQVLANKTMEYMKKGLPLRSYEYYVLETMFSGRSERGLLVNLGGERPMEEVKVRELHFILAASSFGEKDVSRLKHYITENNLHKLQEFIWELGLTEFFQGIYKELRNDFKETMTASEMLESVSLQELFGEEQLIEDFVYFEKKDSQYAKGVKTDLLIEKASREKAAELLEKLYALFQSWPPDFDRLKELMTALHMNRQVTKIELSGIDAFRKYIAEHWAVGARAVAMNFGFSWLGVSEGQSEADLPKVNESFLNQAPLTTKGKSFLCWEALLNNTKRFYSAKSYLFTGRYIMVLISPEEEEDHHIYGYYPLDEEKNAFFGSCLAEFYRCENPFNAAQQIILQYMQSLSGSIRLKNAIRIAILALPIVAIVSLMLGWVYNYSLDHVLGAVLVGGALFLVGEAIAAKNGYSRKIKPSSHEKIPEYVVRHLGIVKIMPISIEGESMEEE
jgi:hypothetical protein